MAIKSFFNQYAKALLSYSADEIAAFYKAPLAVYSTTGVLFVNKQRKVTKWWKRGLKPYKEMGIKKAVPQVLSEQAFAKHIIAKVKWDNFDENNKLVSSETNIYLLSGDKKEKKIIGLIVSA